MAGLSTALLVRVSTQAVPTGQAGPLPTSLAFEGTMFLSTGLCHACHSAHGSCPMGRGQAGGLPVRAGGWAGLAALCPSAWPAGVWAAGQHAPPQCPWGGPGLGSHC